MKEVIKAVVPVRARRFIKDVAQMTSYATPRPEGWSADLSPIARQWLDQLRQTGIVKIEGPEFVAAARYLDEHYFGYIETHRDEFAQRDKCVRPWQDARFIRNINKANYEQAGSEISCDIALADPSLGVLFRNRNLAQVLCHYYRRQGYHRNQPLIQKLVVDRKETLDNGRFHVDHLHQVSLMLLVSDVEMADTHMEYCIGANRRNLLFGGVELTFDECLERHGAYQIFHCVGKKGTAFLFDTSGFHRANYVMGTSRKIMHMNFTTGHHVNRARFVERRADIPGLASEPAYHRNMFRYLND